MQDFNPSRNGYEFIRNLPFNVAIFDREMRYVTWSEKWKETYRLEKDRDLTGESHYTVFPEIPERWKVFHRQGIKGETLSRKVDPFHRLDGTLQYNSWEIRPWQNEEGEVGGIVMVTEDVTAQVEKKRQEAQIVKQKEEFETLFRISKDGIAVLDLASNFLDFNDRYLEMTGYTREELLRQSCIGMSVPEDVERARQVVAEVLEKGYVENFEKSCYTKGGGVIIINMSISLMPDKERLLISTKDVTETVRLRQELETINTGLQKKVEEELEARMKSLRLFQDVVNSTGNYIALLDKNYRYLMINDVVRELYGTRYEEMIGKTGLEAGVIEEEVFSHRVVPLYQGVLAGETKSFKTWVEKKNGEKVYLDVQMFPFKPGREIEGILATAREITREYLLEQENITNREKAAMGELIGIIAHQLKQPLSAIGIAAAAFGDDYDFGELDRERIRAHEAKIDRNVRFMAASIDDLRNFFRPGKKPRPFAVHKAVEKALALLGGNLEHNGIACVTDFREEVTASGIESELQQVVINMVGNARDALVERKAADPFVKVAVDRQEAWARIEIEDNGGGIPEKYLDKIFDSYFTTKGEQGAGIGLNLARTIVVERMGGRLEVRNGSTGAVFTIRIPLDGEG